MVLTTLIDLTGPAGWVLLLVPFMTLAVVVVGAIAGRDRTGPSPGATPTDIVGLPVPMPLPETNSVRPSAPPAATPTADVIGAMPPARPPSQPRPWRATEPADISESDPRPRSAEPRPDRRRDIESKLANAEERFDDAAVARLSLAMAREIMSGAGSGRDAAAYLRRAIIIAARLDDTPTHAAARLELGDILAAEGDMTTACEHWQIARQIFWDGDDKAKLADVDARMVANGCPTDWVLNDF